MDSTSGGIPSPIIKTEYGNSKYYPIPIPFENSCIKYSDLTLFNGKTIWDFINDVAPQNKIKYSTCHLDPDLRKSYLDERPEGWQRAFGQTMQAQAHLEKYDIGVGDVILFFGWFKFAQLKGGTFSYINDKNYPNGFHAIYGYLQIDKIFKPNQESVPSWLSEHPHVNHKGERYFTSRNNTIYTSKELFEYPQNTFNKNGAICFSFAESLILTQPGPLRSTWQLPSFMHPNFGVNLSYNPASKWSLEGDKAILKSAGRGQEFVFTSDPNNEVEKWCINLIKHSTVTD